MSSHQDHCASCIAKFGKPYDAVHNWLDEFWPKFYDEKHRDVRHHEDGISEVRKMWGDEAAEAARLHIQMDFNGWVPRDSKEVQAWRIGIVHKPE